MLTGHVLLLLAVLMFYIYITNILAELGNFYLVSLFLDIVLYLFGAALLISEFLQWHWNDQKGSCGEHCKAVLPSAPQMLQVLSLGK